VRAVLIFRRSAYSKSIARFNTSSPACPLTPVQPVLRPDYPARHAQPLLAYSSTISGGISSYTSAVRQPAPAAPPPTAGHSAHPHRAARPLSASRKLPAADLRPPTATAVTCSSPEPPPLPPAPSLRRDPSWKRQPCCNSPPSRRCTPSHAPASSPAGACRSSSCGTVSSILRRSIPRPSPTACLRPGKALSSV